MKAARFEYLSPTRVVFGIGSLEEAGTQARRLGDRALIICGHGAMRRHGVLDRVTALLEERGLSVSVYDGVSPDPKSDEVDAALALARQHGCDMLVGLGGGSALDAAKAASVAVDRDSVAELIGETLAPNPSSLPVLAIPTTAGSGAEVTKGAIVTDVERSFKSGIRGEDVFPRVAIVDPELSATMPPAVAAETGFDALTHAVETYVARRANPFTEAMSENAARLLGPGLSALAASPADAELRARLSYAALLGGFTVAAASTCLPHRLQQAMGAARNFPLSHGRGLAVLYPAWLERAYPYAQAKFDRLGELLGEGDVRAALERILAELELDVGLAELGFSSTDLDACMEAISGNVDNDPIDGIEPPLMRAIYEDSRQPNLERANRKE
ncbi:MAG TPA: iron-containing alcohol dehydrogenase [Solirubrobacterales bacterium]|nr:iron-containing alcohol dehydrogenase [Solirubrobacterales bacterium]